MGVEAQERRISRGQAVAVVAAALAAGYLGWSIWADADEDPPVCGQVGEEVVNQERRFELALERQACVEP